jgi:hypothetical protein
MTAFVTEREEVIQFSYSNEDNEKNEQQNPFDSSIMIISHYPHRYSLAYRRNFWRFQKLHSML